jgi:DUF1009 family protein
MDNENADKRLEDHGQGEERVADITRYMGSKNIKEMIEKGNYIEAFTHSQMAIEKILLDRIVGIFDSDKSKALVRKIIEQRKLRTFELIRWSQILEVISKDDYKNLLSFNDARNSIIHGHGKWWNPEQYKEALEKGISFIETNRM